MRNETQGFVVRSHRGEYDVRRMAVSRALLASSGAADRLVIDAHVQRLHPSMSVLFGTTPTLLVVADEKLKSLDGALSIMTWLLDTDFNRGGTLYVVGGGTVQDAASFVASILHRGIRWVFVPTTLLAQGDSCIGGKSSINVGGYKNQLGTFYPPAGVVIDSAFLATLAPKEIRSGLGEMLHYAVLGGDTVFSRYETALARGWERLDTDELAALAMDAIEVKREFIEADEFDVGIRKNLNLGHTFGHGIEFASGGVVPHGVAVAYGVDLAASYGYERGLLSGAKRDRIGKSVLQLVDGSELRQLSGSQVLDGIAKDKKRSSSDVELVLIEDLGKAVRVQVPLDQNLGLFLDTYLDKW